MKKKIQIIAEIANSHQGCSLQAFNLAQTFAKAGANSIKFQIYFAEELLVKNHQRYEHFKKQAFTKAQWDILLSKSKKLDLEIYTDIFGVNAYKIAKKHNLRVIEDACEAQGATWLDQPVGSFDIGCFSFYRNKIILI